jgi:hypothetical protein
MAIQNGVSMRIIIRLQMIKNMVNFSEIVTKSGKLAG